MRRWKKGLVIVGLLSSLLLEGCSSTSHKENGETDLQESQMQIGLSFDSFVIERWLRDRDMFVSTAKSLGAEVNVQTANGSVETQISQIRYFIQKGMDVIVIIAIDGNALDEVVKEAKNSGIKIVCYDRLIENVDADLYISFDNEQVGTLMGEALKEACPQGGNLFAIYGSPTDHNVEQVVDGFTAALKGSNLNIVYSGYCDNWLAELAFDHVTEGLKVTDDVAGIMCGNDDLASQAVKALSENRMAGDVAVVAQDAELAACQRIVEGTQTMTVYKPVELEASAAAVLSVALGNGEDITSEDCEEQVMDTIWDGTYDIPYYSIDPIAVTKENMDEVIISGGFHTKEDVYLNIKAD
jgi:D-xylose transport system substrate-binding protein